MDNDDNHIDDGDVHDDDYVMTDLKMSAMLTLTNKYNHSDYLGRIPLKIKKHEKHMKIQIISRIPGSEPILLDLEKLFLLSDSMESSDKTKFFGKNEI